MTEEAFHAAPRSGQLTLAHMSSAAIASQNALWSSIEMLAEAKGTGDLTWLDELHVSAVKEAKGTVAEGIDITIEADAVQYGVDVIDAAFKAYRQRLLKR